MNKAAKLKISIFTIISFMFACLYFKSCFFKTKDSHVLISNYGLSTILPSEQWQGNKIDKKGRFSNMGQLFNPTFYMGWRMLSERNPQKKEKKRDTFSLLVFNDTTFLQNKDDVIVWLGNATFFIRVNGISLITDPVFFNASISKRKSPMPFDANLLTGIDYILFSHDHRDHLDKKSLRLLVKNNPQVEILAGLKMDEWFNKMIKNPKMQLAGWYQQYNTDTSKIKIYFLPARHWSRRGLWDSNKHLWGSFVIESKDKTIFFSGDTGYSAHFKQIGELFNGVDICIMGIGAYKPEWFMSPNHISPTDAAKASNEMRASKFIPMHYGTFDLSSEPLGEPIRLLQTQNERLKLDAELSVLDVGNPYYFNEESEKNINR